MWWFIFFVIIGYLCLACWAGVVDGIKYEKRKEAARQRYYNSLASLKKDPANADLRQRTLEYGRGYSNILRLRDAKGNTLIDEVAIMNDITAVCAATQQIISAPIASDDMESRLRKLQDLKAKGLIDDADYAKRKNEIITQI